MTKQQHSDLYQNLDSYPTGTVQYTIGDIVCSPLLARRAQRVLDLDLFDKFPWIILICDSS